MKKYFLIGLVLLLSVNLVFAHEEVNFTEVKELIDSKIDCSKLTDEQLEEIGEYYMEQMHPGESHELMDEMMGGEGSEGLKQMHINMGRSFYCKEGIGSGGMMNMMGGGMMNMGMMDTIGGNMMGYGAGYGMMGGYGGSILYWLLIIGLVVLVWLWVAKVWFDIRKK